MRMPVSALLVSICLISSTGATEEGKPDLGSDLGLLAFLQRSDVAMSRTLDSCRDVSIARSSQKDLKAFRLKATCTIKGNPEEDLDCPEYRVDASGTIDNAIQATVRQLSMTLVCTA
jgi:hypothetical protein